VITNQDDKKLNKLLRACLRGKRRSQQALYEAFYAYGMSVSIRYAGDRDEAVEILNDAFMKVFLNLKKFDFNKPFRPWFRRILINCAINNYKANLNRPGEDTLDDHLHDAEQADVLSSINYREIIDMIQQLSPAYRTVFNLYVIEGYKHEEIAEMLNISVGTSKSNLAKAKAKLRIILKDYFKTDYVSVR